MLQYVSPPLSLKQLKHCAQVLAKTLPIPFSIGLSGPLGAGKTTFIRMLVSMMGYKGPVVSPSFALYAAYELPNRTIHHWDVYRVSSLDALEMSGWREYEMTGLYCVEWAELLENFWRPDVAIEFRLYNRVARQLCFRGHSSAGIDFLTHLQAQLGHQNLHLTPQG